MRICLERDSYTDGDGPYYDLVVYWDGDVDAWELKPSPSVGCLAFRLSAHLTSEDPITAKVIELLRTAAEEANP